MFAVAVWDDEARTACSPATASARSRSIIWPRDGALYFASEIKALLRDAGLRREINLEALHHFLSYKHVPHPLYDLQGRRRSCRRPIPRCSSRASRCGSSATGTSASRCARKPRRRAKRQMVDRFLELLRRGVARRLMADVPIGFFLSGGIDSSLSTALAAEVSPAGSRRSRSPTPNESTTPGKEDDRRWARWVAEKYGTEHHEETIAYQQLPGQPSQDPDLLRRAVRGRRVSTYFLAEAIARHVKVALSGDGADELFGSYLSHRLALPLAQLPRYLAQRRRLSSSARSRAGRSYSPRSHGGGLASGGAKLLVYGEGESGALRARCRGGAGGDSSAREHAGDVRRADGAGSAEPRARGRVQDASPRPGADLRRSAVDGALTRSPRRRILDTDVVEFVAGLPGR